MRSLHRFAAIAVVAAMAAGAPAVLAATSRGSVEDPVPTRLDPQLVALLADAEPGAALPVIVHGVDFEAASAAVDDAGLDRLVTFPRVQALVTLATPAQIDELSESPGVSYLEADAPLELLGDTSHIATRGAELMAGYNVTVAEETTQSPSQGKGNGQDKKDKGKTTTTTREVPVQADGAGVSIAIVDSGVDGTHPMFDELDDQGQPTGASRVVVNKKFAPLCGVTFNSEAVEGSEALPCFGPSSEGFDDPEGGASVDAPGNDSDTISTGGHGTHVAGIAAGGPLTLEDGRTITGAAPKANIVSLSVGAGINIIAANQALYWVLEHHQDPCGDGSCPPIRVVNNSYGPDGGGEFDESDLTVKIQRDLVAEGVLMAWAAGNDGGGGTDNRSNPPGQDPTPGILMVANYDDGDTGSREGVVASSSSRGDATRQATWPDVAAPGTDITSACRTTLVICSSGEGDAGTISGTSMASPHVAGIVAQLAQLAPTATPARIEDALEDTAHQFAFGAPYHPDFRNADHTTSFDKGHGLVDAVAAANDVLGLVAAPPVTGGGVTCAAGDPAVVDAAGDGFVGDPVALQTGLEPPREQTSADEVDILEVQVVETPEGADVVFTLADVTGLPPEGTDGIRLHLQAAIGADVYYLAGTLSAGPTDLEPAQDFGIDVLAENLYTEIVDLAGSFDATTDTVTIHLTNAAIDAYNADPAARGTRPAIARLEPGLTLSGLSALTQTSTSAVAVSALTEADNAGGRCNYRFGVGAVEGDAPTETPGDNDSGVDQDGNPPPPVEEPPGEDGSLEPTIHPTTAGEATLDKATSPSASFDGVAPVTTVDETCDGPGDPECLTYLVRITEAGELTAAVEARTPLEDFDVAVYDGAGTKIASFGAPGTPPGGLEGGTVAVTRGAYFVVVQPYLADGASDGLTGGSPFTLSLGLA